MIEHLDVYEQRQFALFNELVIDDKKSDLTKEMQRLMEQLIEIDKKNQKLGLLQIPIQVRGEHDQAPLISKMESAARTEENNEDGTKSAAVSVPDWNKTGNMTPVEAGKHNMISELRKIDFTREKVNLVKLIKDTQFELSDEEKAVIPSTQHLLKVLKLILYQIGVSDERQKIRF